MVYIDRLTKTTERFNTCVRAAITGIALEVAVRKKVKKKKLRRIMTKTKKQHRKEEL